MHIFTQFLLDAVCSRATYSLIGQYLCHFYFYYILSRDATYRAVHAKLTFFE